MLCYVAGLFCYITGLLCYVAGLICYSITSILRCLIFWKKDKCKRKCPVTDLNPDTIPKFENQLAKPAVFKPFTCKKKSGKTKCHKKKSHLYFVDIRKFKEQVLPEGMPKTTVWGYGGIIKSSKCCMKYARSSPGPTFEAEKDVPVVVKWMNKLRCRHLFAVDPTLHWANPNHMPMHPHMPWPKFPPGFCRAQKPVPVVTHLHGGEVAPEYDGFPDAWFTHCACKKGPAYKTSRYTYPNEQKPTTLWYHDHALGITRLNVYAGLAGFYLLRGNEHSCESKLKLPDREYEIPMVIQDRSFYTNGALRYPNVGDNPDVHPYWVPEFFGDTIMVNGKVWPNLNVERRQYRFRILNGSNARFYNLKLSNCMKMTQIGTDGGLLECPVTLESILLAPAERADVLIDFSCIEPGTTIVLQNDANAPYPDGDPPDANTGTVMQFTIPADCAPPVKPKKLPERLSCIPKLRPNSTRRILTLNEVMGDNGPVMVLLNGQKWSASVSETPRVGATEEWVIVNLTMDTHPIHLHLIQFQIHDRQDFMGEEYQMDWETLNGMPPLEHPTKTLPLCKYLLGKPIKPDDNERGWKDTVRANPGQVTRLWVRFAPQDVPPCGVKPGENLFPFDPMCEPGYVWHCHILDHEDNEMMRPYKLEP